MKYRKIRKPIKVKYVGLIALLIALGGCGGGGGGSSEEQNSAPTISGEPAGHVRSGKAYSFAPSASDPDNDNLIYGISNKPDWANFDPQTGELTGAPNPGDINVYEDIRISVSDGTDTVELKPFSINVLQPLLTRDNIMSEGQVTVTENGYHSTGKLVLSTANQTSSLENADLQLEFDEKGNLIDLFGETDLPTEISQYLSIDAGIKAKVGYYSGSDINQDPDLGITLQEDSYYLVFYIGNSFTMTVGDRQGSGTFDSITLEPPLTGAILLITDPTDIFYYRYGNVAGTGRGHGESDNGLIPFKPILTHPELTEFDGHVIDNGETSLGLKAFDFFNIAGTRIIHEPQFSEIDWSDPLASTLAYRVGLNGNADFAFAVFGVGLFSFPVAEASALLSVDLTEQKMVMQTVVAPDVSWAPSWMPFLPTTEIVGDWYIKANGEFEATLSGSYKSTVPQADIDGHMHISSNGVKLTGTVVDNNIPMTINVVFENDVTTASIVPPVDLVGGVKSSVLAALDQGITDGQQAYNDLVNATSDYEFEVSLRGIRQSLPAICDSAISTLNGIPGSVATAAFNATGSYIEGNIVLKNGLSSSQKTSIKNSASASARAKAATAIVPYVAAFNELKKQAQSADDESLRVALEQALRNAYNHRTFSKTITVSYDFPLGVGNVTVYNSTVTRTVLDGATAAKVLDAANNAYRIQETSDQMISAQQVYDAIPAEEVFQSVKQEVEDGVRVIPELKEMGYTVSGPNTDAYFVLGEETYTADFNVLNPKEALAGIGQVISDSMLKN